MDTSKGVHSEEWFENWTEKICAENVCKKVICMLFYCTCFFTKPDQFKPGSHCAISSSLFLSPFSSLFSSLFSSPFSSPCVPIIKKHIAHRHRN